MNTTNATIHERKPIICKALPFIPSYLKLAGREAEHRSMGRESIVMDGGKLYVNGQEVIRFLLPNQRRLGSVRGSNLFRGLKCKRGFTMLNACIMDAIYEHPELYPDEWTDQTHFWGTIFIDESGNRVVGYLYKLAGAVYRGYAIFDGDSFTATDYAACLKENKTFRNETLPQIGEEGDTRIESSLDLNT